MIERHDTEERRREAERPLEESGEGVSEGFELAEEELRRVAEGEEDGHDPMDDAYAPEEDAGSVYGEADEEHSSEKPSDDFI